MIAAALSGLWWCNLGCAGFGIFGAEDSPPVPATMIGLHAAIDEQRALLLDLVSEAGPDGEQPDDNPNQNAKTKTTTKTDHANQLVAISKRLTQLTAALKKLERESDTQPSAP